MIGLFMRNKDNHVCFVRLKPEETAIASFQYTPAAKVMMVNLADGDEVMFTSEIAPEIHEALLTSRDILVAEMDKNGDLEREYTVALIV
jgi:hypothetical protein